MRNHITGLLLIVCFFIQTSYANNIINTYQDDNSAESIWVYTKSKHDNIKCFSFSNPHSIYFLSQSCIDVKNEDNIISEYNRLIVGVLYLTNHYDKILMIGLGGGIMPTIINKLLPDSKIDIVEINSNVVKVAREEFGFVQSNNMNLFIQDGLEFVKNTKKKYDIIIIDAFDSKYVPKHFLTDEFFENLVKCAKNTGVLVFNSFANTNYNKLEEKLYAEFFNHKLQLFTSNGNKIVFTSLDHNIMNINDIKLRHERWQNKLQQFNLDKSFLIGKFINYFK